MKPLPYLVLFGILGFATGLSAKPGSSGRCSEKNKSVYPYPIILKGEQVLYGIPVNYLKVFTWKDGSWREIPSQIDEVNSENDYVLSEGLPYTKNTGNGIYDGKDELVFSGVDAGDSFTEKELKRFDIREAQHAWQAKICRGENFFGSILIVSSKGYAGGSPKADGVRKVTFDRDKQEVSSGIYRYRFHRSNPVLFGQVWLKDASRKGELEVLSDAAFKMAFNLPWWLPNVSLEDKDFVSTVECWQSGPVRTIIAVGVKFKSFLSFFDFHMFSELVFYENLFQIPTVIEFAFDPAHFLKPGSGLVYSVKFAGGRSWDIETNLVDLPAKSAAEVAAAKINSKGTPIFFATGHRPEGSFLVKVRVDERARSMVPPPFLIRKDMFGSDPWKKYWPWMNDFRGDLGLFLDIANVRQGTYDFGLDLVLSSKAQEDFKDYGSVETDWQPLPIH